MEETIHSKAQQAGEAGKPRTGLAFKRYCTKDGTPPLDAVKWARRRSVITEPNGKIVFELKDCEVPEGWSQLATDIVVSKYFRKAGVPGTGHEVSVRQVIRRIALAISGCGHSQGRAKTRLHAERKRTQERISWFELEALKVGLEAKKLDLEAKKIDGGLLGLLFGQGKNATRNCACVVVLISLGVLALHSFLPGSSDSYTSESLMTMQYALKAAIRYLFGRR
jgi:hypothetical protein